MYCKNNSGFLMHDNIRHTVQNEKHRKRESKKFDQKVFYRKHKFRQQNQVK